MRAHNRGAVGALARCTGPDDEDRLRSRYIRRTPRVTVIDNWAVGAAQHRDRTVHRRCGGAREHVVANHRRSRGRNARCPGRRCTRRSTQAARRALDAQGVSPHQPQAVVRRGGGGPVADRHRAGVGELTVPCAARGVLARPAAPGQSRVRLATNHRTLTRPRATIAAHRRVVAAEDA